MHPCSFSESLHCLKNNLNFRIQNRGLSRLEQTQRDMSGFCARYVSAKIRHTYVYRYNCSNRVRHGFYAQIQIFFFTVYTDSSYQNTVYGFPRTLEVLYCDILQSVKCRVEHPNGSLIMHVLKLLANVFCVNASSKHLTFLTKTANATSGDFFNRTQFQKGGGIMPPYCIQITPSKNLQEIETICENTLAHE